MRKIILTLMVGLSFVLTAMSQERTITGRVVDSEGKPVQGASILIVGLSKGTSSSSDGTFSISVPTSATAFNVSAVNFETQRVSIRNSSNITIALTAKKDELDEVIVTGIKNVRRAEFAGAATKINKETIENKPVGSFDQLLQGAAPGLLAVTTSGAPGTSANVTIRGSNSINGGATPLYIVDGIPVEASTFQGLNPNDFASVDILKDQSSTAMYGSRGGAGVIVITTKRGTGGKMKLSYANSMGIKSKPEFGFRPMTTAELLQAQNEYGSTLSRLSATPFVGTNVMPGWFYAQNNPRYAALSAADKTIANSKLDSISKINTDWTDYMFRQGSFSNHEISLSGGTGKTRMYSSLGVYNEEGVTPRTDMKRISFRNNLDYSDDKLTFSVSSSLAYTKRNFQQSTVTNNTGNPFLAVNISTPYARVFKDDGSYFTGNGTSFTGAVATSFVGANQLDITKYDENYNNQLKAVLAINTTYKITDHISANVVAGADFRETQNTNYGSRLAFSRFTSTDVRLRTGFQSESLGRNLILNIRPSLNFRKEFNEKHVVDVTLLGEAKKTYAKSFNLTGYGIDPRTPNTPAAITQGDGTNLLFAGVGGGLQETDLYSGLAMGTYTYDKKYSITGSYRQDGSSYLAEGKKWVGFYSIGAIWTASNEDFLKNSRVVNNLRVRASYGGAGNENNFPFSPYYSYPTWAANGNYSGLTTMYVNGLGNPNLTWETTWSTNLGVDFGLFNNRLNGSLDVYDRRTKDVFVLKPLTGPGGGAASIYTNAGEIGNKGVELDLSYDVIRNSKFTWTVRGNFGYNKNEVLSLAGELPYVQGTSQVAEGLPLGSHFEVGWAGVDQATGAPLYYKKDGTITTAYSANDKVQTWGTYEAPWKGGFGTSLKYQNFDLSVLFTWQEGSTKVDNLEYFVENPVGFLSGGYNQSADLKFWQNPGDVVKIPSPAYATNFSSNLIHDASFLRLRDVTFSYTLPKDLLKKSKIISSAKFFVTGQNLFIWTKWRGMDPEAGPVNINLSEFPNPRAITGGVNITF